jgi:hypothetical protein
MKRLRNDTERRTRKCQKRERERERESERERECCVRTSVYGTRNAQKLNIERMVVKFLPEFDLFSNDFIPKSSA